MGITMVMNAPFESAREGFLVSTDKARLQPDRIHRFLSRDAYWSMEIPLAIVQKAIEGSLCFGVYQTNESGLVQVGFARVITDSATFAWLSDVYVEAEFRGQGLAEFLVQSILNHPSLKGLRRICLATKDAHGLYAKFGFEVTQTPGYWMEIKDSDIYRKMGGSRARSDG